MSRPAWCIACLTALLGATLAISEPATAGDAAGGSERVRFTTADGVTIHGNFFRGPKTSPTVLMLHALGTGENRSKKNWVELAKALSKDFAVLTFDFRGHGESVDIDGPLYVRYTANRTATKGAKADKSRLDFKEIEKNAYPLFCNDIAAAKSYLERTKNDLGVCNTQNFILVGADQGATVGAIWANSEWYRYRMELNPTLLGSAPRYESRPEGKWLSAFVYLSITPKLGSRDINLGRLLDVPCRVNSVPAIFLYSDGDAKTRDAAKALEKSIKAAVKKDDRRLALTAAVGLKAGEKITGVDLLQDSLKTSTNVHEWLKLATQNNTNEWSLREFSKSLYVWRLSLTAQPIPARVMPPGSGIGPIVPLTAQIPDAMEKNILFDTYERFIPR